MMSDVSSKIETEAFRGELPSVSSTLLNQIQAMQPEAWARLVDVFSPMVYRWARQAGLSGTDASDVVQDVFLSVARNVSRFEREKESASFRSWLATITRNRVRDVFRRKKKNPTAFGGSEALENFQNLLQNEFPNSAESGEMDDRLEKSISVKSLDMRLPFRVLEIVKSECDPKTWQAFWQTAVDGDAAGDVADRLEMRVASVYQAKSRILRRLRKRLAELP